MSLVDTLHDRTSTALFAGDVLFVEMVLASDIPFIINFIIFGWIFWVDWQFFSFIRSVPHRALRRAVAALALRYAAYWRRLDATLVECFYLPASVRRLGGSTPSIFIAVNLFLNGQAAIRYKYAFAWMEPYRLEIGIAATGTGLLCCFIFLPPFLANAWTAVANHPNNRV